MKIWMYKTGKGTFSIRPQSNGRFLLKIGDEGLGSYSTPEQAADDVFCCATGHHSWDSLGTVDQPTDLSEWECHVVAERC